MSITIREVARQAGVSPAAVSKVLHGRGASVRVSEERAAHIRQIAETLQYRPNAIARNLRSSRTHTVGLIFENFANIAGGPLYYMHLLDGVASPLFQNHYRLTILPELDNEDIPGSLGDGQLEGVIWCKLTRDDQTQRLIQECPIPIVALNAPAPSLQSKAVYISCDNDGGIDLAVKHLVELGHRRILFLHEWEERNTPDTVARREAFVASMTQRVGPVSANDVAAWGWNFDEFADWWTAGATHTAVVCWSERSAGQLLMRAAEAGVDVPRQLSVVGFDSTQYCETTRPRLTAVKQPIFEMARFASQTLLDIIRGQRPPSHDVTFPCSFDVRESTGEPYGGR